MQGSNTKHQVRSVRVHAGNMIWRACLTCLYPAIHGDAQSPPSSLPWVQAPPRPLTPMFDSPVFHSLRISCNQSTFCGLLAPSYPLVSVLLCLSPG